MYVHVVCVCNTFMTLYIFVLFTIRANLNGFWAKF